MSNTGPFITFYTPTFRRPLALRACMESVGAQTASKAIEHLVLPDYEGIGIAGMYARVPLYAPAVHGRYVHVLADDDVLAATTVVEDLARFAEQEGDPEVIVVRVNKGGVDLPIGTPWPPVSGRFDLGNMVTRADVWKRHCQHYGRRYEGDFDFADTVWGAGHKAAFCDLLFMLGDVRRGKPEPEAAVVG